MRSGILPNIPISRDRLISPKRRSRLITPPSVSSSPLISSLTDTFASQDSLKWQGWTAGSIEVASNQLRLACTNVYPTLTSTAQYDITGSAFYVEVPQIAGIGSSTDTAISLDPLASGAGGTHKELTMVVENTTLYFRHDIGTRSDTSIAYNAVSMRWWQISESGGTVTWSTSPDGITWTTRRTASLATSFNNLYVHLQAGYWGTESSPRPALFDNVNIVPVTTRPFIGWGWGV